MKKTEICLKAKEEILRSYPQIEENKEMLEELNSLLEESYLPYLEKIDKESPFLEKLMIKSLMEEALISLGFEDLSVEESLNKEEYVIYKTYEQKYKNIEATISKGNGGLTSEERDILAAKNMALVHSIVKRFGNTGIEYNELLSAGFVGYTKALTTFAKGKDVKFSTYAYRCIKNEILYFLRREKRHRDNDVSLSKPMSTDKNGNVMTVESTISNEDMGVKSVEDNVIMGENVKVMIEIIQNDLTEIESFIMMERNGLNGHKAKTQKEIADDINMSQANVSKLEKNTMEKIRKIMMTKYKIKAI